MVICGENGFALSVPTAHVPEITELLSIYPARPPAYKGEDIVIAEPLNIAKGCER